jgi:hypothetical protein
VQEKRVPMVIVELQVEATPRLVRREIQHVNSAEPAALYRAADERPAQATLQPVVLRLEQFA